MQMKPLFRNLQQKAASISLCMLLVLACISTALQGLNAVACNQNHLHVVAQYHQHHVASHAHHCSSCQHSHLTACEHQHDNELALGDELHLLKQSDDHDDHVMPAMIGLAHHAILCEIAPTRVVEHRHTARAPPPYRQTLLRKQHTELLI